MSYVTWEETLNNQQAAGTALTSTLASILNPQAIAVIPAGSLKIGSAFKITAIGNISNIATTPGALTLQVRIGPVIPTTIVLAANTSFTQLNATAHTNLPFIYQCYLTCQVLGSGNSARFISNSQLMGPMWTRTAGQVNGPNTNTILNPTSGIVGFNSTVDNYLDFWAGFSAVGNSVQIQQYMVESLN